MNLPEYKNTRKQMENYRRLLLYLKIKISEMIPWIEFYFMIVFLYIYQFYSKWRRLFFAVVNKIMLIYHNDGTDDSTTTNITLYYYLNCLPKNYETGTYYVKFYNSYGTNHIAFNGNISDIKKLDGISNVSRTDEDNKRKFIVLLGNDKNPLFVNLEMFDNYRVNMQYFPDSCVTNLGKIFGLMGLKCDRVMVIVHKPFNKYIVNPNEINIDHLYS